MALNNVCGFGTKFSKIFCGPTWSCDVTNHGMDTVLADVRDPLQVVHLYIIFIDILRHVMCRLV